MKPVIMFMMARCPYCRAALQWMAELREEYPEFKAVEIEMIDETEQPDIANTYDYYFVPTYYVDGKKVHEGAASKQIVESMFRAALEQS